MANNVVPDQTPRSAASDQGLHCLQRSICPNTSGNNGNLFARFMLVQNIESIAWIEKDPCQYYYLLLSNRLI